MTQVAHGLDRAIMTYAGDDVVQHVAVMNMVEHIVGYDRRYAVLEGEIRQFVQAHIVALAPTPAQRHVGAVSE